MNFFEFEPSARTSWRLAILMGANDRTYKFALGTALLQAAAEGRADLPLRELAVPYAMSLVRHMQDAPQARPESVSGRTDYLAVAEEEAAESLRLGSPTERLLAATLKSMPEMVLRKFHNLRGAGQVPHRFYEVTGNSRERIVRLSPDLRAVATGEQAASLRGELDARWSIVETSFAAGVGRSLIEEGVSVDLTTMRVLDKRRRRPVTGVTEAVIGFQHGRCLICREPIVPGRDAIAVDHVFPFSLMDRFALSVDLDALWNMAPAHASCNLAKSNRPPSPQEVSALVRRNEAIMNSPHPLRRTLELTLGPYARRGGWHGFVRDLHRELS